MKRPESGQTIVALLVFMMVAMTLALSATVIVIVAAQNDSAYQMGDQALQNADTGIENALLRLERDPAYSGETMTLISGAVTITVSGTSTKTIVSVGSMANAERTVTAIATFSGGAYTLSSWSETP